MRHAKPTRVLAYVRVSGARQANDGTSLEAQRERVESWCRAHGHPAPVVVLEVESGGEEKREKRVEFDRLIQEARHGELIVVCKVDRWTRDISDGVKQARALVKRGVDWYSIDEGIDASTSTGDSMLGLMSWVADQERKRIRERTVGARDRLRDQGLWVEGPEPFGYRRGNREERRHLELNIVPEDAALVRGAFERCASGSSLAEIADWFNVERGTDHAKIVFWRMLRNRIYCGETRDSAGRWIQARWEPIVTRELFERAQRSRQENRKNGRRPTAEARTATWLLRGLGACPECGSRMGAAYSRVTDYYACGSRTRRGTCSSAYARVDAADARADDLAAAHLVELRTALARTNPEGTAPKAPDFAAARARIAAKIARAERGYVDGVLSAEAVRRERERLDAELGRIEVAAGEAARAERGRDPEARNELWEDVQKASAVWKRAPIESRRSALVVMAKSIRILGDDVRIEWKSIEELCAQQPSLEACFAWPDDLPPDPAVKPPPRRRGPR